MSKNILIGYSIFSSLHLINFMIFFLKNKEKYDEIKVFIGKGVDIKIIPNKYINFCSKNKVDFLSFHERNDFIDKNNGNLLDFVFVNYPTLDIFIKSIYKINLNKVILIDEGISTYANKLHINKAIKRESGNLSYIKYKLNQILIGFFYNFFKDKIIRFNMFIIENNYKINYEYKENLINIFADLNKDIGKNFIYNNAVVFCSQPLVELGLIEKEKYINELRELKYKIETRGLKLLIKKHPKEYLIDYISLDFEIVNFEGMVEEFLFKNSINSIISNCSTSSLIAGAFLNIDSYIVDDDLIKDSGKDLNILFSKYCKSLKEF